MCCQHVFVQVVWATSEAIDLMITFLSPFPWVGCYKISIFTGVATGLNASDTLDDLQLFPFELFF